MRSTAPWISALAAPICVAIARPPPIAASMHVTKMLISHTGMRAVPFGGSDGLLISIHLTPRTSRTVTEAEGQVRERSRARESNHPPVRSLELHFDDEIG